MCHCVGACPTFARCYKVGEGDHNLQELPGATTLQVGNHTDQAMYWSALSEHCTAGVSGGAGQVAVCAGGPVKVLVTITGCAEPA
jgi:hypothetical protein